MSCQLAESCHFSSMTISPLQIAGASNNLPAVAKDGSHQPRIPAPVNNRDDPERLLVWYIGDEVLIARYMESQRSSGQVRTSVSDVW